MAFRDTGLSCVDDDPLTLTLVGYGMRWDGTAHRPSSHMASSTSRRRGYSRHGHAGYWDRAGTPHTDRTGNERGHERISSDGSTCLPACLDCSLQALISLCAQCTFSLSLILLFNSCRSREGNGCYSLRLSPSFFLSVLGSLAVLASIALYLA